MIEQGIARNFHFVKLNALARVGQAYGRRVADEVDFVASRGKLHPQLRGNHA